MYAFALTPSLPLRAYVLYEWSLKGNSCVATWFCKLHTVIFTERQAIASYMFSLKNRGNFHKEVM